MGRLVIEKAIAFSAPEWEALGGLPFMQRCLYLVLRWYMDRTTGRVGDARGISLQGLAEELYVEPVRGRHASECGSPSKKAVRSALDGLEKAGLISPCGNGEVLVFFLPKSRRASARQKDEGHMRGTDEGHSDGHGKNMPAGRANAGKLHVDNRHEGHDEGHTKNPDEGHTSSTRVNHPSTQASAAAYAGAVDNSAVLVMPLLPEKVAEWIRLQERQRGCRAKVIASAAQIAAWLALAVTGDELHEAYSLAKVDREVTQNQAPINLPFLDIFVRRVIAGRVVSRGAAVKPTASAWWHSEAGIVEKANAVGVDRLPDEPAERLRGRVELALMHLEDAEKQRRKAARTKRGGV